MKKKEYYGSPRITSEVLDCALPMTFDQYSNCGFTCLYCFSGFQRGVGLGSKKYYAKFVKSINIKKVKNLFELKDKTSYFYHLIKLRMPLQWGGLSEPFCPFEEKYGIGLDLLKFFNKIKYPISFSSKSDLLLRDERYFNEFAKAGSRWHYKASIITDEADKAKIIEIGVPTPDRRFEVLSRLSKVGVLTTLRLRPFIIGLSDKTLERLIKKAKEASCQSVSAEFLCVETRILNKPVERNKFNLLSKTLGYDIIEYYRKNTKGAGYLRLSYNIKKPHVKRLVELCKKYDIALMISDAHHKEKSCSGCCCGILDNKENKHFRNYAKIQFTNALQIAKKQGIVTFSYLIKAMPKEIEILKGINIMKSDAIQSGMKAERYRNLSLYDWIRLNWNDFKRANSPYKYFEGILEPISKDDNGNIVYKYNYKKTQI